MKTVIATLNAIESGPDTMAPPTDAQGHLGTAASMIEGARILAKATPIPAVAHTYLCGHAVETSLKAMLSKVGVPATDLKKRAIRHRLTALWTLAHMKRLVDQPAPQWLEQLDRVHAHPYTLRYPLEVHAFAMPNAAVMMAGVEALFSKASA